MDTLDRYLAKEFFLYWVFSLMGLVTLYLGIDFVSKLGNYQMPVMRVVSIYLFRIPFTLQQFMPVACLLATLLVLSAMSKQNEVLALYSGGISAIRIASTLIALVATVSTLSFLLFDPLVPSFAKKEHLLKQGLDPNEEYTLFNPQSEVWYRAGNRIYNFGLFEPKQNRIEDVAIFTLSDTKDLSEIVLATRGHFDKQWLLEDTHTIVYPADHFPILTAEPTKQGMITQGPSDFKQLELQEGMMRLKELRRFIQRKGNYGLDTVEQKVKYHERVALIFAPLVFVLIGIPFAMHPLRSRSMAKSMGFCAMMVFFYLLTFRISLSVGKGGMLPPIMAAWLPNVTFLGISAVAIWRK